MLPQTGHGILWDEVTVNGDRGDVLLFVPESKKIFHVSICNEDIPSKELRPTEWIQWTGVGIRDAAKPSELMGVTPMPQTMDRSIVVDYPSRHRTVMLSVLLFPDREDLGKFVGENNAWSNLVGIVKSGNVTDIEITRGAYCTGYIERDPDSTDSSFLIVKDTIKFPEGYKSEKDQNIFEGMAREIELAEEEAKVLALKGRKPGDTDQVIPAPKKTEKNDEFSTIANYGKENNRHVLRCGIGKFGWELYKSESLVKTIQDLAKLVKDQRYHDMLIYKSGICRGKNVLFGWTPMLGTVPLNTDTLKEDNRRVKIGHNISTRIEFNKHLLKFEVDQITTLLDIPKYDFQTRERNGRTEILIKIPSLNLKDFKIMEQTWKGKRVGILEHSLLFKILIFEETILEYGNVDDGVSAILLHYEGMEKDYPERVRLVLESINDDFEPSPSQSLPPQTNKALNHQRNQTTVAPPDEVEDDYGDDDDENEEGSNQEKANWKKQFGQMNVDDGFGDGFPTVNGFGNGGWDNGGFGGGFSSGFGYNSSGGFGSNDRGGSRGGGRGGFYDGPSRGRYDDGRGGARGGMSERMQPPRLESSLSIRPDENHGFGQVQATKPQTASEQGVLVCYSHLDSYFYTKSKRVVLFTGNANALDCHLGRCAEFDSERMPKGNYRVVPGSLKRMHGDIWKIKMEIHEGEVYIHTKGYIEPDRDFLMCNQLNDVPLTSSSLKLVKGGYVDKNRLEVGHHYDVSVKFSSELLQWQFVTIDNTTSTYKVEEEDEIDRIKREQKEANNPRGQYDDMRDEDVRRENGRRDDNMDRRRHPSDRECQPSHRESGRETRYSVPSRRQAETPSVMSSSMHTSASTITDRELIKSCRDLDKAKHMVKAIWEYKPVVKHVKATNYFLHNNVDDLMIEEAEEGNERSARRFTTAREIKKETTRVNTMIKALWAMEEVQGIVMDHDTNAFLLKSVQEYIEDLQEDELMNGN